MIVNGGAEEHLGQVINRCLQDPGAKAAERRELVKREVTFTDGGAARRTAGFILSILEGKA